MNNTPTDSCSSEEHENNPSPKKKTLPKESPTRDMYLKSLSGTISAVVLREGTSSLGKDAWSANDASQWCRFVAIVWGIDITYNCTLPAQCYPIKGNGEMIEISPDLQYIFNNYLLERNFHGYALCTASDCILTFFANYRFDSQRNLYYKSLFHQLPIILRLNAPLVHAPLIRLMGQVIGQSASDDQHQCPNFLWLNQYIDYWNTVALPILEELFLWGVQKYYTAFKQIQSAVEACVSDDSYGIPRCNRLNLYRIIPRSQNSHVEQLTETYHSFVDPMGECGYLSNAGFKITADGLDYQVDVGRCTAFDDEST